MKWLPRLLKREVFTPLEKALLEALKRHLQGANAALFTDQLGRINLGQRDTNGRETRLYAMRAGRPHREPSICFPTDAREQVLASMRFDVAGEGRFSADFHLVDGFLFSIEFTPSPASLVRRNDVIIHEVIVHQPPVAQALTYGEGPAVAQPVSSARWLNEAPWTNEVQNLSPPLAPSERVRFNEIAAILPSDYVSGLEVSNGFAFHDVKVLSLPEVYDIVLEDASYYVLAQVRDWGVIAVRKHSANGVVYLLPFDDAGTAVGPSFREALRAADRSSR